LFARDARARLRGGGINHFFFIKVAMFYPTSGVAAGTPGHPASEGILNQRWWSLEALDAASNEGIVFSPRGFPRMFRVPKNE
jgi:8-oxo-dGTP diphosphatase